MIQTMRRLLIANRGEIAIRIIQSARALGIETVAVYSELDQNALYTRQADFAYLLEGEGLAETYLNIPKLMGIAQAASCDALHPGYGFLSENRALADACEAQGLIFVGPKGNVIHSMGNKLEARSLVKGLGVPLLEGVQGDKETLLRLGKTLQFPLLVKAASGGGGKGMRIVERPEELEPALETTSREALASFSDATVYIETYLLNPRHIEVQIMADQHGNVVYLGERECSIQRRHQKIVEESPSPIVDAETRQKMGAEAIKIAKAIGYTNAGTIEFLMDQERRFYFLEMNTRIQVEHPVTELVYGVDLIMEQLRVAMGHPLSISQDQLTPRGHAIECRIYAEDPTAGFRPAPGEITLYKEASGPWVRNDSGIEGPGLISPQFDPMISKLIVWGGNRADAILRMKKALRESVIQGISNNINYLYAVMEHPQFLSGMFSTAFCQAYSEELLKALEDQKASANSDLALIAQLLYKRYRTKKTTGPAEELANPFQLLGAWRN